MNRAAASKYKREISIKKFTKWSQLRDTDSIAWIPVEKGYTPQGDLPDEVEEQLRIWVDKHK